MCGIVGATGAQPVANLLLDGIKKLEYRGYDSAGIALIDAHHEIERLRVVGKVRELEAAMANLTFSGTNGIAHTRWATHGEPSERNAHPFISHNQLALVHNGIIENHAALRAPLQQAGYAFQSETDTEVAVHLIYHHLAKSHDLLQAVSATVDELEGAYAFAIIAKDSPERLIAVRQGSPLVVGKGQGTNYIASDPIALLAHTQQFIYLEDGDVADITPESIQIYNKGKRVNRDSHVLNIKHDAADRGEYRYYMQKEIMEQPDAIASCLEGRLLDHDVPAAIFGHKAEELFKQVEHIQLIACGTSYHAAMVGRYWLESLTHLPCSVEVASEFRYRDIAPAKNSLFVTLSQSGETADTLAALRLAKKMHYLGTLAICNAPGSTMMREAELQFLTRAGIEIGVASTKAFSAQLIALLLLALSVQHTKSQNDQADMINALKHVPVLVQDILKQDAAIAKWAELFVNKQHAIFLGRGSLYPIALEGALKMKEISYIHAEGYPSGELKHGPLALVDANMPVIATLPNDHLVEKNLSNLQEVRTRGGQLYLLADKAVYEAHQSSLVGAHVINMPSANPLLNPILYTIPLQLLAYHVAVLKGTDVDQPRNLAKSVTVE